MHEQNILFTYKQRRFKERVVFFMLKIRSEKLEKVNEMEKRILEFGDVVCNPGEKVHSWMQFADTEIKAPITIINGIKEGKTILLTSGIHGGEYPSIESAVELAQEIEPKDIKGGLVIFHPINVDGFLERVSGIYPSSGENLNRQYPGKKDGTIGQKFAYALLHDVIKKCDGMIDIHGGDIHEQLPPYVYYPGVGDQKIVEQSRIAATYANVKYMVKSQCIGNAYHTCNGEGIPSMLLEMGGKGLWTAKEVEDYKYNIKNVLRFWEVLTGEAKLPEKPAYVITDARYIDASESGCWYPQVEMEEKVKKGQLIGVIKDFFGNTLEEIHAEFDSIILFNTVSLAIKKGDPIITYGI